VRRAATAGLPRLGYVSLISDKQQSVRHLSSNCQGSERTRADGQKSQGEARAARSNDRIGPAQKDGPPLG